MGIRFRREPDFVPEGKAKQISLVNDALTFIIHTSCWFAMIKSTLFDGAFHGKGFRALEIKSFEMKVSLRVDVIPNFTAIYLVRCFRHDDVMGDIAPCYTCTTTIL